MTCKWRTKIFSSETPSVSRPTNSSRNYAKLAHQWTILCSIVIASALPCNAPAGRDSYIDPPVQDMTMTNYEVGCSTVGCHQLLTKTRWVHAPVATGDCTHCHKAIGEFESHSFESATPETSGCVECHSFSDAPTSSHEPFALGTCIDCHDPHGGKRKSFIWTQSTQELCVSCHDESNSEYMHHPVSEGDCLTCHEAHQSNHEKLLVQSRDTLCISCHKGLGIDSILGIYQYSEQRPSIHDPVAREGCVACHVPHGSDEPALLIDSQRTICLGCHEEMVDNLPLAKSVHSPFESDQLCTNCHSPHSSDHDKLLTESSSGLCFTCHNKETASAPGSIVQDMKSLIAESPVVHEPAARGECTNCHASHYSTQKSLLLQSYPDKKFDEYNPENYAMCLGCHDPKLIEDETSSLTNFRNGTQNLHYLHINRERGRSCGICHEPHAGSQPALMREHFPFGPGGWELPIGFTQSISGGSCISACHEQRAYDYITPVDQSAPSNDEPDP